MSTRILSQAARLSDQELVAAVKLLAHRERTATAVLIAHLAVFEERRLYLAEAWSSLFIYCTKVLHLSEHAAYNRIEAVRAARKFPPILDLLAEGAVNLTTVRLLAPHLTLENHCALLDEARHKGKREIEELVARLRPQPPVPSTIRRLRTTRGASHMAPAELSPAGMADEMASTDRGGASPTNDEVGPPPIAAATEVLSLSADAVGRPTVTEPSSRRPIIQPLAPLQYRVQFTASEGTHAKLRLAQDLLRHQIPDGDVGKVIDQALTVLLRHLAKQKHAAADRNHVVAAQPREGTSRRVSEEARHHCRHVPADVKRAVWARDEGRCAFMGRGGRRCAERGFLEFHHVVPFSTGGEATAENIQLRCRAHNQYEAERDFGPFGTRSGTSTTGPARLGYPRATVGAPSEQILREGGGPAG